MALAKFGDTVAIRYTGKSKDSSVFGTQRGHEPLLLTIGQDRIIPALEEAIIGMKPGESKTIKIAAAEAYGLYRKELVRVVSRNNLANGLQPDVGQRLKCTRMDGRTFAVTVTDISEKSVTLDANHPLAGKNFTFEIQLMEII